MRRAAWLLMVLILALAVFVQPAAASLRWVWAVDDGEKIYQDDIDNPLKNGDGNAVWDGTTVSLFSARNEIVAFQLILEADGDGAQNVDVVVSNLTNGTDTIRGSHPLPPPNDYRGVGVELFTEHYLNVTDPSGSPTGGYFNWSAAAAPNLTGLMPDALVPFSAARGKGGAPFDIPANMNQGVWVDIYVAKGLSPGLYTGTITVKLDGATHSVIPLRLQVLDFDLPDELHYHTMIYFSDYNIKPRYNLNDSNKWPMLLEFHKMAHRHRLELIGNGTWDEINNLPGVLTGDAFTPANNYEGPGEGVGNTVFSISTYGVSWPDDESSYRSESDAWVNWFQNNAPNVDYFLYLTDEPSGSQYDWVKTRCDWVHNNPGPGSALPVFVTERVTGDLIGYVDIWGSPTQTYSQVTTAAARARGEEVWPYAAYRPKTPADVIDEWGIAFRLKPWIAHKCDISRWFTWESTHWIGNSNELDPGGYKNVWENPKTFETSDDSSCGNGDGTLFYPGEDYVFPSENRQFPGPIASYRMKMYRRGEQDVEYMWLAEQAGKSADVQHILQDVIPHVMDTAQTVPDWSNHDIVYEEARHELAELIGPTQAPHARFQGTPTTGSGPLTVAFTDLSTNSPTSWSWDFGDGSTSTEQNPTHVYTSLGGYSVSLTVANAQGSDTEVKNNYVNVVFEVTVYPDSWDTFSGWAGASEISGTFNDDLKYDDDSYWVTRSDDTQEQRYSIQYYADTGYTPSEVARITAEFQAHCSPNTTPSTLVFLMKNDGGFQYMGAWDDSSVDTWCRLETTDVSSYMTSSGRVGFELCCCPSGSDSYDISADVMRFKLVLASAGPSVPTVSFDADQTLGPPPLTVNFTDHTANSPTSWSWDFGDGSTSTEQNPTHTYTTIGYHTVTLTAANARGSDTLTRTNYITVQPFSDVPFTYWAWNHIKACVNEGIVQGFDDNTYRSALPVTRDQMAVYISRALAGGDANVPTGPATATFSDVPTDHWAYKYIEYAAAQNIVGGYDDGTYRPTVEVDRAQMAVFIARAVVTPTDRPDLPSYTPPSTPTFPDVPTDHWAYKYIEYIAQPSVAVTQGYDDGTYRPDVVVTRDQMAVYVQRAFELPM